MNVLKGIATVMKFVMVEVIPFANAIKKTIDLWKKDNKKVKKQVKA